MLQLGLTQPPSGWASLAALSLPPVFLLPQRDGDWELMAQVWVTQASRGHWSLARAAASLPPASPPPLLPTFLQKTLVCMESSTAGRCWGWGQAWGQPGPLGTGPSCHVCFAPWCQGLGMVGSSVYPTLTDCCLPFLIAWLPVPDPPPAPVTARFFGQSHMEQVMFL